MNSKEVSRSMSFYCSALNLIRRWRLGTGALIALLLSFAVTASSVYAQAPQKWIATWAASPMAATPGPEGPLPEVNGQTIRERMRVSLGGSQLRVRITNEFGEQPLNIGSVTVAMPKDAASVDAKTITQVTFSGEKSIMVPAGAPMVSDPIDFPTKAGDLVTVSIYTPDRLGTKITLHMLGLKTAVISKPGDFTHAEKIDAASTSTTSMLVSALLVPAKPGQKLVVALGDSITDGNTSTLDGDRNWPSDLLRRIREEGQGDRIAVVNHGISGNKMRYDGAGVSALKRFDRDVLALPGVTHIVLLEGINDIGWPGARLGDRVLSPESQLPTAEQVIESYKQIIARAHMHGIKIYGATLTPFKGTGMPGYYAESKELIRVAVNEWIRNSGAFDAVIDFDAALRDPQDPKRMLPRYASDDKLHPGNEGYQAMADAVDLSLFE